MKKQYHVWTETPGKKDKILFTGGHSSALSFYKKHGGSKRGLHVGYFLDLLGRRKHYLIRGKKRIILKSKSKKTGRVKRSVSLKPYTVGGPTMSKKRSSHKKRGGSRGRSMRGEFGGIGVASAVKPAMNFLGTLLLSLFGAAATSFIANKIPASMPGSRHVKVLLPAAIGLGTQTLAPRSMRAMLFPAACGAYAVSGVTAVKTYLPGVPLLAGDAGALEVPQYTIGADEQGRLIDTRDGSLLLNERGQTLGRDGEPFEEAEPQIEGEGDMLGSGDMLGAGDVSTFGEDDFSMVGEGNETEDIFA